MEMDDSNSSELTPDIEVQNAFFCESMGLKDIKVVPKLYEITDTQQKQFTDLSNAVPNSQNQRRSATSSSTPNPTSGSARLNPTLWQDGRTSAFSPYKAMALQPATILTNIQRGNVETQSTPIIPDISNHQLAAQGELFFDTNNINTENVNELDGSGLTMLMWSCAYGQTPTVKALLQRGADPHIIAKGGQNCLLHACSRGHADIAKILLEQKLNVNHQDELGNTALMYAAYGNHSQCCQELLKRGSDITLENGNGDTAYSIAVTRGSKHVQIVLEKNLLAILEPEGKES